MQFIIDNLSKLLPAVLLIVALFLFAFAFIGGAFGLHFDQGQLDTLTKLLFGLGGIGVGSGVGAALATREIKASLTKEQALANRIMNAVGVMQEATVALQKTLFKVQSHSETKTGGRLS